MSLYFYILRLFFFIFCTEDDRGNVSKWKESLAERTLARKPSSLMQLVYRESTNNPTSKNEENDSGEDDEFFYPKDERKKVSSPLLAPLVRNGSRNFNIFNISFPC
jgi:hypothetical protein